MQFFEENLCFAHQEYVNKTKRKASQHAHALKTWCQEPLMDEGRAVQVGSQTTSPKKAMIRSNP